MPERDDGGDELRREFLRQAPAFDLHGSLPGKVETLVRRRARLRRVLAVGAAAAVVAAVAVPLSALRSAPVGHAITPATTPTSSATTAPTTGGGGRPLACGSLDLSTTPAGTAVTTTASLANVTATLTGTVLTRPSFDPALSHPVLSVTLGDGRRFSEAVGPPRDEGLSPSHLVIPTGLAPRPLGVNATQQEPGTDALCLARFPGEDLPTALFGMYTGYAHCCTVIRAIALSTAGLSPAVEETVGNPGASLRADGADAMFVTADSAFAYEFTAFAYSGMPLELLQFDHGAFVNITKRYSILHPDLAAADASAQWKNFADTPADGLGYLAAWVADECVVGRGGHAWATVDQLEARGKLGGPFTPTGGAYVRALRTFLTKQGYC